MIPIMADKIKNVIRKVFELLIHSNPFIGLTTAVTKKGQNILLTADDP